MAEENYIEKMSEGDRFARHNEIEIISCDDNAAVVGVNARDCHLNANNVVQGGMLYTLADMAFAVLVNHLHPRTVSQSAQITFIAPCAAGYITAEARELVRRGHNCICQAIIRNEGGETVAVATVNGFIKEPPREDK